MPTLILPPPEEPLSSLLSEPHAVAVAVRASTAAEAATTLESFMENILCVEKEVRAVEGRFARSEPRARGGTSGTPGWSVVQDLRQEVLGTVAARVAEELVRHRLFDD